MKPENDGELIPFSGVHHKDLVTWEHEPLTGLWFRFFFHLYFGKIPILPNIFQVGWNHQLAKDWQVLSLSDVGFLLFFRVDSGDYGKSCLGTICDTPFEGAGTQP